MLAGKSLHVKFRANLCHHLNSRSPTRVPHRAITAIDAEPFIGYFVRNFDGLTAQRLAYFGQFL